MAAMAPTSPATLGAGVEAVTAPMVALLVMLVAGASCGQRTLCYTISEPFEDAGHRADSGSSNTQHPIASSPDREQL